jgi:hypothetical protein
LLDEVKLLEEQIQSFMLKLVKLCKEIYETGIWPEDFTKIVMIPIPKKNNAIECADHRTISLISHASKILLKILTKQIEAKTETLISKNAVWLQEMTWHKRSNRYIKIFMRAQVRAWKRCTFAL